MRSEAVNVSTLPAEVTPTILREIADEYAAAAKREKHQVTLADSYRALAKAYREKAAELERA